MQRERWQRLERLFDEAAGMPKAARPAFLDRHCADDASLRQELDELLRAHDGAGVLDGSARRAESATAQPAGPAAAASLASGTCLGAWRIERLIGRGGMGEVYAAVRADGAFEQRVALKLIRFDAVGELQRFHGERRILARLEHPGIARLLDGGTAPDGRPYTVMEYVEGLTLTDYCRQRHATLAQRLDLFAQVCAAVAFAHRNLVIHRDLKPANILVDAHGQVKLLDFGIAKLLDVATAAREADATMAPFTPDYAAPEQLLGQPATTATDVYALGVLLFELLTDERPLALRSLPSAHALTLLLERAPPAPSRIARDKPDAPIPARALAGDLDAIVAKCLRKEATHRYETVSDLERELQRHRRNEPVLARSGARAYVARRFLRRHWLPAGALLTLVLAIGAAAIYANAARLRTEQALHRADAVRDFVIDLFRQNDPEAGNARSMSARDLVDIGARRVESSFGDDLDTRIELLGVSGNLYRSLGEYQRSAELLARRLEQAMQAYGADDPRRLDAQLDMAEALIGAERFDEARSLLDRVASSTTTGQAGLEPLRARLLLALGRLEDDRGSSEQAVQWSAQAVEALRRSSVASRAQLADALAHHGLYIFRTGRIADAETPLRDALALVAAHENDALGTLLSVRESLGKVLTSLGRFDEALPLLRANAASLQALLGDRHPLLADALHQLASATRQSGDFKSAIPLFQQALALYERNFGPDHSFVATALTGLGQTLSADGQHEAAMDALLRAQGIYTKTLGPLHSNTVVSMIALADARLAGNDLAGAEAGFRAALDAFARIGDGRHIYAEAARLGLGKTLSAAHRYEPARIALTQARERFATEFGADDRRTVEAAVVLVHCLLQLGRRDAAQALLESTELALSTSTRDVTRLRTKVAAARQEFDGH